MLKEPPAPRTAPRTPPLPRTDMASGGEKGRGGVDGGRREASEQGGEREGGESRAGHRKDVGRGERKRRGGLAAGCGDSKEGKERH